MENRIIELHDSTLSEIRVQGDSIDVVLSHAYIHKSLGVPGLDPGTGWSQHAVLKFNKATLSCQPISLPCNISDGSIKLDNDSFQNSIPIPLPTAKSVELKLLLTDATQITISGGEAELKLTGEAKLIENYDGYR